LVIARVGKRKVSEGTLAIVLGGALGEIALFRCRP